MTRPTAPILAVISLLLTTGVSPVAAMGEHDAWDALLKEHVEPGGWVDYAGFAADREALDRYVDELGAVSSEAFAAMPDDARLALLINAYNAFTIQLILDHWDGGELRSIRDLAEGNPWDHYRYDFAGRAVTLNQLEHELIRGNFDEPRIHWAVVCAAYSCPPLRPEAYTADRLDAQLAEQEDYVLGGGDPRFLTLDRRGGVAGVTKLFEWYGQDFGDDWKAYLRDATGYRVDSPAFLDYDWSLNDVRNKP